jgi:hypothetical protein
LLGAEVYLITLWTSLLFFVYYFQHYLLQFSICDRLCIPSRTM